MAWLLGTGPGAFAQPFDLAVDGFRKAYDGRLKQDGRGGLASCRVMSKLEFDCAFRGDPNAGARGSLAHLDHREHMALQLDDGKLVRVILNGQRNTPAAEKHFIGLVASVIGTLSPGLDKVKIDEIVAGLGLTRDDNSPDIGTSLSHSEPAWTIQCLSQYSQVATDLACTIEPGGT
jgi:hypothetical protein